MYPKLLFILLLISALAVASCNTGENNGDGNNTNATENEAADGAKLVPGNDTKSDAFNRDMPEKVKRAREEVANETNNTLSPYRFAISSSEYSMVGKLLKVSTLSKHIHGAGVTFLAPRDRAFKDNAKWKEIISGGPEVVDAFLAPYVIDRIVSYKELKETDTLEAHDGSTLKVEISGGITINGASVSMNEIMTDNGILIGMNELFPEE